MLLRAWNLLGVHVLSSRDANPESVMMTAGDLTIGRTTWRDLLKIKVQCFNCQKQGPVCVRCLLVLPHVLPNTSLTLAIRQAAIGFLCMQPQDDGHNCVSRRERRVRDCVARGAVCMPAARTYPCDRSGVSQLQNTYKGTGEEELQATMNRHYGYAHAGGMQDTVAV